MAKVEDLEAREIITGLLRRGGAWKQHKAGLGDECDAKIGTLECVGGLDSESLTSSPSGKHSE